MGVFSIQMNSRAQTGVELLMVVAVSLVILIVLLDFTSTQFNQVQRERNERAGKASLDQLVAAINEVYAQGPGASKQIQVIWPDGIDSAYSQVSGHTIRIRINGTDVVGSTTPAITGSLPLNSGPQFVRARAFDGFVSLGDLQVDIVPSAILARTARDANKTVSLAITNNGSTPGTLVYALTWADTDVNAILVDGSSQSIGANAGSVKDLNFVPTPGAVGTYTGVLSVQGTFPDHVETQLIPIALEISTGSPSPLSIYPGSISLSAGAGDSNSISLQVCNTGTGTLSGITFTPSSTGSGSWVQGIQDVNSLLPSACQAVDVNVVVPAGSGIGTSVGLISVSDYSGAYASTIPLSVVVRGMNTAFQWDWSTAGLGTNNISNFTLSNTGNAPIQVSTMAVRKWETCDTNHSTLSLIRTNNITRYSGTAYDGNVVDVADFNIPVLSAWTNNALIFYGTINNEGEQFAVDVGFADGTSFTSETYGAGCAPDTNAPGFLGITSGSYIGGNQAQLNFVFPGDDENTGFLTDLAVKVKVSLQWADETIWDFGSPRSWSGTIVQGGTSGSIVVNNIFDNTCTCIVVKAFDDANNISPFDANTSPQFCFFRNLCA